MAARAHMLVPHWDPTRTSGITDHGRGLLDATALALHVLWTYQGAWADEGALANARLPASVWRLLALVGYHPDPGTGAFGLQHLRAKDGVTAVLPPGSGSARRRPVTCPPRRTRRRERSRSGPSSTSCGPSCPCSTRHPRRPVRSLRRSSSSSTRRRSSCRGCGRSRTRSAGGSRPAASPRSPHATRRVRGSRPSRRRTSWPSSATPVLPTSAATATTRCARSSVRPRSWDSPFRTGSGPSRSHRRWSPPCCARWRCASRRHWPGSRRRSAGLTVRTTRSTPRASTS